MVLRRGDFKIHFDGSSKGDGNGDIKIQRHQGKGYALAMYHFYKEELLPGERISLWGPRNGLIREYYKPREAGG